MYEMSPVRARAPATARLLAALALGACTSREATRRSDEALRLPFAEVEAQAKGARVTWAMWQGDPFINDYVRSWVAPRLAERYGITLETVSAQGSDLVATVLAELEAGRTTSAYDIVWINGETFFQLRRAGALLGPFLDRLPNAPLLALDDPFVGKDFQQPIEGHECPWGTVQMTLIHDAARVPDPPRTPEALAAWVAEHPGRFTWETGFTGLTFLKSLLAHFAGGRDALRGPFDEARYREAAERLWAYVEGIRPSLWKGGATFPARLAQLHQLFAQGEVDFTMSNNDAEAENKVARGLFPETTRAYVWDIGTIRNAHYLGILARSDDVAGALVTLNFLISPEAQLEKLKPSVWGDGTVLAEDRLPEVWRARFEALPPRTRAPERKSLRDQAIEEPAPEYMLRLDRDFRARVLESSPR